MFSTRIHIQLQCPTTWMDRSVNNKVQQNHNGILLRILGNNSSLFIGSFCLFGILFTRIHALHSTKGLKISQMASGLSLNLCNFLLVKVSPP